MTKIFCKSCKTKIATWMYMPSCSENFKDFLCDDCVPRGCTCNSYPLDEDWENTDPNNWQQELDEQGRELPCCEWGYEEDGYDEILNERN